MNASVKKKDGKQILESSLRSVSSMLTRKINAVKVKLAFYDLAKYKAKLYCKLPF